MALNLSRKLWICGFFLLVGCSSTDRPDTRLNKEPHQTPEPQNFLSSLPYGFYCVNGQLNASVIVVKPTSDQKPSPILNKETLGLTMSEDSSHPEITHVNAELSPTSHFTFDLTAINSNPQAFRLSLSQSILELIFTSDEENHPLLFIRTIPIPFSQDFKPIVVGNTTLIRLEKTDHKFVFKSYQTGKTSWFKISPSFQLKEEMALFTGTTSYEISAFNYDLPH